MCKKQLVYFSWSARAHQYQYDTRCLWKRQILWITKLYISNKDTERQVWIYKILANHLHRRKTESTKHEDSLLWESHEWRLYHRSLKELGLWNKAKAKGKQKDQGKEINMVRTRNIPIRNGIDFILPGGRIRTLSSVIQEISSSLVSTSITWFRFCTLVQEVKC